MTCADKRRPLGGLCFLSVPAFRPRRLLVAARPLSTFATAPSPLLARRLSGLPTSRQSFGPNPQRKPISWVACHRSLPPRRVGNKRSRRHRRRRPAPPLRRLPLLSNPITFLFAPLCPHFFLVTGGRASKDAIFLMHTTRLTDSSFRQNSVYAYLHYYLKSLLTSCLSIVRPMFFDQH